MYKVIKTELKDARCVRLYIIEEFKYTIKCFIIRFYIFILLQKTDITYCILYFRWDINKFYVTFYYTIN